MVTLKSIWKCLHNELNKGKETWPQIRDINTTSTNGYLWKVGYVILLLVRFGWIWQDCVCVCVCVSVWILVCMYHNVWVVVWGQTQVSIFALYPVWDRIWFWCYIQQASWPIASWWCFYIYLPYHLNSARITDMHFCVRFLCRFWASELRASLCVTSTLPTEPSPFNDVQVSPIHWPQTRLLVAAMLEIKVMERGARASRWSWGESSSSRATGAVCELASLPIALSGHTLEFAWDVPVEFANRWRWRSWDRHLSPFPVTFFLF